MFSCQRQHASLIGEDVLVFFDMIPSLIDDGADMVVRKGIENGFPFSAAFYQFVLLQDAELMGNGRLGHVQHLCKITYSDLCLE